MRIWLESATSPLTKTCMNTRERIATEHDARQPFIEYELIEAIKQYNCVTYRQLSGHINHWCQHCCIEAWLKSHDSYSLYAKNIKPGLSSENQLKQVPFPRRVHWRLAQRSCGSTAMRSGSTGSCTGQMRKLVTSLESSRRHIAPITKNT
jgi:hypothetical protein